MDHFFSCPHPMQGIRYLDLNILRPYAITFQQLKQDRQPEDAQILIVRKVISGTAVLDTDGDFGVFAD